MRHKVVSILDKAEGFIEGEYFSDLESPKECTACAVGQLIRNLPEEDAKHCIDIIVDQECNGDTVDMLDHSIIERLTGYYGVTEDQLKSIQLMNDGSLYAEDEDRKRDVLKQVVELFPSPGTNLTSEH